MREKCMAGQNGYSLRMRQIPKPEYKLMKALVKKYSLKDDSELFQVALTLLYEVSLYNDGIGDQWIHQVITSLKEMPEKDRVYTP
jgi:hypothetical protein